MLYPTLWRKQAPNIWDELFNMRSDVDRMLGRSETQVGAGWCPVVDVHESNDEIMLQAELPGLSSDDVELNIENGVLTISGEKKQEREEGEEGTEYHLVERRYGRFERRFSLPRSVDPEKVKAEFKDGVLAIRLPKVEAAKPRRIAIKASAK
jgi:HSP20 family protein